MNNTDPAGPLMNLVLNMAADQFRALLQQISPQQRLDLLHNSFGAWYCTHCGGEQPETGRRCQCSNDE